MAGTPIVDLISSLYDMVEDAWSMPLGGDKCILERDKVLDILDEVRANLPADLKLAKEIVERRNKLMTDTKDECIALKNQAEEYVKKAVNDHQITIEARKKADGMLSAAEAKSREMLKVTSDYCDDIMKRTEDTVAQMLTELKQARSQFRIALREKK